VEKQICEKCGKWQEMKSMDPQSTAGTIALYCKIYKKEVGGGMGKWWDGEMVVLYHLVCATCVSHYDKSHLLLQHQRLGN